MIVYDKDTEISNDEIEMVVPVEATKANEKKVATELGLTYESVSLTEELSSDNVILKVISDSEVCEKLRDNGDFFLAIADALNIDRETIIEID